MSVMAARHQRRLEAYTSASWASKSNSHQNPIEMVDVVGAEPAISRIRVERPPAGRPACATSRLAWVDAWQFRKYKGTVKMCTLLDLRGNMPLPLA
jgi:hypothetical protein